jgi:hypothetical protein
MSFFTADVDANASEALKEAQSGGDGKFPPLPKGEYQATIVPLKKDGDRMEVVDFGGTGANAKKKVLRVAVKISDDSPTGKGRIFFVRVPMFSRYAPNEKHPQGAPARGYFDFFGKGLGVSDEALTSGNLGIGPDQILGKPINIVLSEPQLPDDYNPLGFNEVSFFNKPGPANTPVRQPGVPVAPWLDADDNLIAGVAPGQTVPGGAAAAAAAPVDPWSAPTEQDVADAVAQAVPAQQGGVAAGPWAQAASY